MIGPETPADAIAGTFLQWLNVPKFLNPDQPYGVTLAPDDWPKIEEALNKAGFAVVRLEPDQALAFSGAPKPPRPFAAQGAIVPQEYAEHCAS